MNISNRNSSRSTKVRSCFYAAVAAVLVTAAVVQEASAISCWDGETRTKVNGSTTDTETCACNGWYLSARSKTGTLCGSAGMSTYYYSRSVYAYYHSPRDCQVRATSLSQSSFSESKATGLLLCYKPTPEVPFPPAPDACVINSDNYYRTFTYQAPSRYAVVTGDWHWWTTSIPLLCSNGNQYGLSTKQWGKSPWE